MTGAAAPSRRRAAATSPCGRSPPDARPDPEEIHARLAAAFNAGDADAFAELHEPDATVIVPPDGRRVSGRDAIRAAVRPVLVLGPTAEIELVDKLQSGDLALSLARVEVFGSVTRGTVVSRRQADGSWRIVLDNPRSP